MRSSERSGNLSYREVVVLVYRCIAASHSFYWGRVISRSSSFFKKKRLLLRRVHVHRFALRRFIRLFRLPFEQRLILLALGDTRKFFH